MSADARVDTATEDVAAPKEHFGLEVLAVLGVSFGLDGLRSLLDLVYSQLVINHGFGLKHVATAPIKSSTTPDYQWLDILYQLVSILQGLAPAFLAIVLLLRSPAGRGLGIGLDRFGWREIGTGAGFAALIGIPGLGLVYAARRLGLNAQIVVTSFPDVWYRVPTLLLEAFQQGIGEEVVICAFLLTRFRQLGWSNSRALVVASVARGSYHLYQGYGGFIGNAIMGLIFGWWFQRTRRVWPLVIAHGIIDAVSFIGYVYLVNRVSWI
ncbi:CPBP family intramembrane glutamic endopeptidase [Jatrophihabitans endophyticus]|uniref:CPBP family intramembrane glutamic endopeptidase n=1 Tax=Jatrophihabitans endophyticus TaxID=1206085 RepID=UPI0019F18F71|nr:type II CAAX endopeptidase family protein [Jatrophihabitans endophyticus]MBE7186675.1 CPBP family intramembrane metalloprotease [Jatrophihabitans endophyticus]